MPHSVVLIDDEKKDNVLKFDFQSKADRDRYYKLHSDKMNMHLAYSDNETKNIKIKCGEACKVKPCFPLVAILELCNTHGIKDEVIFPDLDKINLEKRNNNQKEKKSS